jgi:membrane-associated phospholipid phosphatase
MWMLYPATVSFGVIYLGEHYIADVVVGLALGIACYAAAELGYQAGQGRRRPSPVRVPMGPGNPATP